MSMSCNYPFNRRQWSTPLLRNLEDLRIIMITLNNLRSRVINVNSRSQIFSINFYSIIIVIRTQKVIYISIYLKTVTKIKSNKINHIHERLHHITYSHLFAYRLHLFLKVFDSSILINITSVHFNYSCTVYKLSVLEF